MTTPAEELRTAAETLRSLAKAATPGPWATDSSIPYGHRVGSSDEADWIAWTGEHGEDGSKADAAYIAAMHPSVGSALADWLDSVARRISLVGADWTGPDRRHALTVARAINEGGQ